MSERYRLSFALGQTLLLGLLMMLSSALHALPRVGLLTMNPGEEYWARYGHNALLVFDGDWDDDGTATSYNFGFFDFDQPGFLTRFLRGDMRYQLVALPYQQDMSGYATEGRGVRVQWLNLSESQASQLASALANNALPENAEYRYDYFTSNCSTRVRDALNDVLHGEIERQTSARSHGLTYRSEALRLSSPLPWMAVGIHFGLGPSTDLPMNLWQEAWVPERLASVLRDIKLDGRPLVRSEVDLLPALRPPAPASAPQWKSGFALSSVALLALLALLYRPHGTVQRRLGVGVAALFWLTCGLAGAGLLALWLLTDHSAAWANHNLLLASPLCLILLGATPALWRGQSPAPGLILTAQTVFVLALIAMIIGWLATRGQRQVEWLILLLPAHALLTHRLWSSKPQTRAG